MRTLVEILSLKKDSVMQCNSQAGNITTNRKVNVDFTLPLLSVKNVTTGKFHVHDFANGRYDMILGRDI